MSKVYTSAAELIGKTPLLELTHIEEKYGLPFPLLSDPDLKAHTAYDALREHLVRAIKKQK